jgi:hypothetical protein
MRSTIDKETKIKSDNKQRQPTQIKKTNKTNEDDTQTNHNEDTQ